MKLRKETWTLLFIFFVAFGFHLAFLFQVPFFSSDESYFHLRHSQYITEHFSPIVYDSLSYGGNVILNTHILHYFLGILDIFLPEILVYKILPALFASSIVFVIYLLAKKVTENEYAALFGALLAAFVPSFLSVTINQISTTTLFVPLFLFVLYGLLTLEKQRMLFLFLSLILVLLEPLNLLLLFTLLMFIVLSLAESHAIQKNEMEAIGLFTLLFLLINLIFFKQLYLTQGLATVWQNLPLEIYGNLFQNFDLFQTIAIIGIVPLILGVLGLLVYKKHDRTITLFQSVLLADFTLLLLRLIPFEEGVLFLAIVLCVTAAISIEKIVAYIRLTKAARYKSLLMATLVIVALVSLIIPSVVIARDVVREGVTVSEIEAMEWIRDNTPEDSVVAGNVYEGNLIIAIAQRANIIDTQFFYAEDRILDVETIFTTESLVKATQALRKYGADYLYVSKKSQDLYVVSELPYIKGESCFEEVFRNDYAIVYKMVC